MTISGEDLLTLLTTQVTPVLQDFQGWVNTVNNRLRAIRDNSSTDAFPASVHLSFVQGPEAIEELVVAISFERRGPSLTGRADLSTGEGKILLECDDVELGDSDPRAKWEAQVGNLVEQVRAMLQSARAVRDVQLVLSGD